MAQRKQQETIFYFFPSTSDLFHFVSHQPLLRSRLYLQLAESHSLKPGCRSSALRDVVVCHRGGVWSSVPQPSVLLYQQAAWLHPITKKGRGNLRTSSPGSPASCTRLKTLAERGQPDRGIFFFLNVSPAANCSSPWFVVSYSVNTLCACTCVVRSPNYLVVCYEGAK